MAENPTVKEIVAGFLKANGYDGLFDLCGECACELDDLMPCDEPNGRCTAGYKFRIVAEKPGEKTGDSPRMDTDVH